MKHEGTITTALNTFPREYWKNDDFAWVSIPKNANSQFRNICASFNATRQKNNGTYPATRICVWRNPRTRLISGLGEWCKRRGPNRGKPLTLDAYGSLLTDLLNDSSRFDEHLEPQIVYAGGICFTHVLCFENLIDEMLTVPAFKSHPEKWNKVLKADKLTSSKHTNNAGGLDAVQQQHKQLIDQIINKYYKQDQEVYENRRLLTDPNNIMTAGIHND